MTYTVDLVVDGHLNHQVVREILLPMYEDRAQAHELALEELLEARHYMARCAEQLKGARWMGNVRYERYLAYLERCKHLVMQCMVAYADALGIPFDPAVVGPLRLQAQAETPPADLARVRQRAADYLQRLLRAQRPKGVAYSYAEWREAMEYTREQLQLVVQRCNAALGVSTTPNPDVVKDRVRKDIAKAESMDMWAHTSTRTPGFDRSPNVRVR